MPAISEDRRGRHVLVIAVNAMGHLIPAMEISIQLVRMHGKSCRVSLAISANMADDITRKAMVPPAYMSNITIAKLIDGNETMEGVPNPVMLTAALDKTKMCFPALRDILRAGEAGEKAPESAAAYCDLAPQKFDLLIVEGFMIRVMPFLEGLTAPIMILWASAATVIPRILAMGKAVKAAGGKIDPTNPASVAHMVSAMGDLKGTAESFSANKSTTGVAPAGPPPGVHKMLSPQMSEFMELLSRELENGNKVQLINTFEELETKTLAELRKLPVFSDNRIRCVGPLSLFGHDPINETTSDSSDATSITNKLTSSMSPVERFVSDWLTVQSTAGRPVVYISFGSLYRLSQPQIVEFITALRSLNNVSFLWSLHDSRHVHIDADAQRDLIHIYSDHTPASTTTAQQKRVLVMSWVPQPLVLSHSATRAFVTHCGWNSTLESLSVGVPLICWPIAADQHSNAAFITSPELFAGILVPGTADSAGELAVVPSVEISSKIKEVLGNDTSVDTKYYTNARRMHEKAFINVNLGKGNSALNIKGLLSA